MATTEAEPYERLAVVRRLEAAGFRAWPAGETRYDGTWALRLTASFPAKRLNSVNPLDPFDRADVAARVNAAAERFARAGRPLLFRQSPLAPPALAAYLDANNWERFDEAAVLVLDLRSADLAGTMDRLPLRDAGRYLDASLRVHGHPIALKADLARIFAAIRPPAAFFVQEEAGEPVAVVLAVIDGDLAGILDLAVAPAWRRRGIARGLVATALRHALGKGARTAWLQVEAANEAGLSLYRDFGFAEAYRYVYRRAPG